MLSRRTLLKALGLAPFVKLPDVKEEPPTPLTLPTLETWLHEFTGSLVKRCPVLSLLDKNAKFSCGGTHLVWRHNGQFHRREWLSAGRSCKYDAQDGTAELEKAVAEVLNEIRSTFLQEAKEAAVFGVPRKGWDHVRHAGLDLFFPDNWGGMFFLTPAWMVADLEGRLGREYRIDLAFYGAWYTREPPVIRPARLRVT